MSREEKICSNTIFVYIEINGKKGYWKWSKHIDNIKKYIVNKLIKSKLGVFEMETNSVLELKKFIKRINENGIYKFYVYDDVDKALEKVKQNNSYIYINKSRTFREDNYCCE